MSTTLVIQSQRRPLPAAWLEPCLRSVESWAALRGFDYRFLDDCLFDPVPPELLEKTAQQPVVATDLARLHVLKSALDEGYEAAVWCDADTLVFAPDALVLPTASYGLGREVWVQPSAQRAPKAYVKVHNAFMFFRQGNPFLDFYIDSATRLLELHQGPFAPQFIGPKLLSAIHNIVQCPVIENAAMLSPAVIKDLLAGDGNSLRLFLQRSPEPAAAVNLCSSLVAKGEISEDQIAEIIEQLSARGRL